MGWLGLLFLFLCAICFWSMSLGPRLLQPVSQEMSHKELSTECLQKRLPVPSSSSREDMVQLLIMDRTAQECVSCYEQRGIPATRLSSHWIAYDLARRFDEFDGTFRMCMGLHEMAVKQTPMLDIASLPRTLRQRLRNSF